MKERTCEWVDGWMDKRNNFKVPKKGKREKKRGKNAKAKMKSK